MPSACEPKSCDQAVLPIPSCLSPKYSIDTRYPSPTYTRGSNTLPSRYSQSPGSRHLTPDNFDPSRGAKPFSPFYTHPTTQVSIDQLRGERGFHERDTASFRQRISETDTISLPKGSIESQNTNSTLWSTSHKKRHGLLGDLTQRQKFCLKLAIAIVIIGGIISLGLGLSIVVSGGVRASKMDVY